MITHKIDKYKDSWYTAKSYGRSSTVILQPTTWARASSHAMNKLEFALFLKNLDICEGDVVTYTRNSVELTNWNTFFVRDIDEIHKFVEDWGDHRTGPIILSLQPIQGALFKAGTKLYQKIDPKNWPICWKDKLAG